MRKRIKSTLEDYPGVKNRDEHINKKVQEGAEKLRITESEYWASLRKMKSEVGPHWKMPADSLVGKRPVEEEMMEKVEKAHRSMAEKAAEYKTWLKEKEKQREEDLSLKLQERQKELKDFKQRKQDAQMGREADLAGDREMKAQQAGRYWTWLATTKNTIAQRETTCAPFVTLSGTKSAGELTHEKKAELAQDVEEREREYKMWLESIKKSKNIVPLIKCNSTQERDALIHEKAKKANQKLNEEAVVYKKWVKEMEQQHHERNMVKVREKLAADQVFDSERGAAKDSLREKMLQAKQREEAIAAESNRELREMYERVQRKPLMVEAAYRLCGR